MKSLPAFLTEHWKQKSAALALALLLWTIVRLGVTETDTGAVRVPVRVDLQDAGWVMVRDPDPDSVTVALTGTGRDARLFAPRPGEVVVPVEEVTDPVMLVHLRRDWVSTGDASRFAVSSIDPPTIELTFERVTQEARPVTTRTEGRLADDLALAAPLHPDPAMVQVRGAAGFVAAVDTVYTLPVDLSAIRLGGSELRTVPLDTAGFASAVAIPAEVRVPIRVDEAVERTLDTVPVEVSGSGPTDLFTFDPPSVSVELSGAAVILEGLTTETVRAVVSPAALQGIPAGGERRVPIQVEGVPGFVRVGLEPDSVTARRAGGAR